MQCHRRQPHLNAVRLGMVGNRAIGRKQSQLVVTLPAFIEGFDLPAPIGTLAVIDFAEIQHLSLHHFAAGTSLVLNDVPVAMLLAVFDASLRSEEHTNELT
jgi:hypothetical protein